MTKKNKVTGKSKPVLSDHVRKRRKLIPPFLAAMGDKHKPFSWARDIAPEAIWIALLVDRYGLREGAGLVSSLCSIADKSMQDESTPSFCRFSGFLELNESQKTIVRDGLSYSELVKITRGLYPLHRICPSHPLAFLFESVEQISMENDVHPNIQLKLEELYDRLSKISALSAAVATYASIVQDKLVMPKEMLNKAINDLEAIVDYPETEDHQAA